MEHRPAANPVTAPEAGAGAVVCACGVPGVVGGRFCTRCGTRLPVQPAPWVPPIGPHADESRVTPTVERELLRALRDIDDGHLGLWGTPETATADRVVSGALHGFDWVGILLTRRWIAPNTASAREILVITDEGRQVLEDRWTGWRNRSTFST